MPDSTSFLGFEEPKENFYRLPNNWFSEVIPMLRETCGTRMAGALKLQEYILSHTWGFQDWNGKLRLSAREIREGRKRGRYKDKGTGLADNTIKAAGDVLEQLKFITISQDLTDKARKYKTYSPNIIAEPSKEEELGEFNGFAPPTTNYFTVPHNWTDITREISSAATIIVVEYAFRHAWGYKNEEGTWMTANEFSHGRKYKTKDARYDNGIGFDEATIYRALEDAVERGLMVFAEFTDEDYYKRRVYNLRLSSMTVDPATGSCLHPLPSEYRTVEAHVLQGDEGNSRTIEDHIRTVDDDSRTIEDMDSRAIEGHFRTIDGHFRTVEDRSLKDTTQDAQSKTPKTTTSNDRSQKNEKVAVAVALPDEMLAGLAKIGWNDITTEVERTFAKNPELVQAWLDFALHKSSVQNRAGQFRKGIRSQRMPVTKTKSFVIYESHEDSEVLEEALNGYATEPPPNEAKLAWLAVKIQLEREMPRGTFIAHVRDAHAVTLTNNILQVQTHSTETKDWLEGHVQRVAENMLVGLLKAPTQVQFMTT